jgi:xanthine dehydrogenase small subunit
MRPVIHMRDTVRFTLNGTPIEVRAPDPTRTVLEWLREERRLTGTKEGCAEGDCGACTVMVIDPGGQPRAINSCIQFLPMIDGCALVTVEGLGGADPVQKELIAHHGSQCGFCTPGFVMALHAHHARGGASDAASISDAIAGNLCRCTGYGPILRAGGKACSSPRLQVVALVFSGDEPLGYEHRGRRFFAPTTLDQMVQLCEAHPQAVILGGATDVGLRVTKQGHRLETVISVMRVRELQEIRTTNTGIAIGAAVRYAEAHAALANLHPSLNEYVRRLGAAQVRDSGTVVGNIANGSPIGDMPPVLIALGASIRLRKGASERTLPLEQFFIAYGKQDRAPGEIVTHVDIPNLPKNAFFAAEKISKRFEQDISAISAGFMARVDKGVVAETRLVFGGMAGIPKRAARTEAMLVGKPWNEANVQAAVTTLAQDFQPLTDWRGSAEYRLASAQNLLLRFYLESLGSAGVTRVLGLRSLAHG